MDAIFVVDPDCDTLDEAWKAMERVIDACGSPARTSAESVRLSLTGTDGMAWLSQPHANPVQVGWHFAAAPTDDFIPRLAEQADWLQKQLLRFRLRCDPFGSADSIELRFDPGGMPHIAIPFEDRVENAPRFFGRFRKAFAAASKISESTMDSILREFYSHCESHLEDELPYDVSESGLRTLWHGKKGGFRWFPRKGRVGTHAIFRELHITHIESDSLSLIRLLPQLGRVGRMEEPKLYLQFFSPRPGDVRTFINASHLHEMTFQYDRMPFQEAKKLLNEVLEDPSRSPAVTDAFMLFDLDPADIGAPCSASFQIRRARTSWFEVRVSPSWPKENIDPDMAILPLEKKSGLTFARIT